MLQKNIRPYEISLWTLQDGFISVLKPLDVSHNGQIETPRCRRKNDGTEELSFVIPMFYYENGEKVENPIWYNVIDGLLIVNLRKLKLIFNKGGEGERIFEFVIQEVKETHTDGQIKCEVIAEGLAFQELGKIGYKISLTSQDYINDYNEWYETEFNSEEEKNAAKPLNNLDYWCKKIFDNCRWNYEVKMDWSGIDGINSLDRRNNLSLRQSNKVYEEEYVSSWEAEKDRMVPTKSEPFKEKLRLVELEKSNIYNLTQDLAKAFGVYCKYEFQHDTNYHITNRKCVFYNNFLAEREGSIDIIYPYDASKIERKIQSSDVVTKLYVVPVEDDTSASGLITIADVSANKAREDYILNFDYLYSSGTITDEQYSAIEDYQRSFYLVNVELESLAKQRNILETELVEFRAKLTLAKESQLQDKNQMSQANALMNSVTEGTGFLYKNLDNPESLVLLPMTDSSGKYYVKITAKGITNEPEKNKYPLYSSSNGFIYGIRAYYYKREEGNLTGVLTPYIESIHEGHTAAEEEQNGCDTPMIIPASYGFEIEADKTTGNITAISKIDISRMEDRISDRIVLTYSYSPYDYYRSVYDTYADRLAKDEAIIAEMETKIRNAEEKIQKIKIQYDSALENKRLKNIEFENMMGPAIREGSWLADNYNDYGDKYEINLRATGGSSSGHITFIWDSELFDGEQDNSETFGANQLVKYFPYLKLSNLLGGIANNLESLSIIYEHENVTKYLNIGSQMCYSFISDSGTIIPVLLILKTFESDEKEALLSSGVLGIISSAGTEILANKTQLSDNWVINGGGTIVYPRFRVNNLLLKTSSNQLIIKMLTSTDYKTLEKYNDYSVLVRGDNVYITVKNEHFLSYGTGPQSKNFKISYALSNASLYLYLDALEVAKTNSVPRVSYTLQVSGLKTNFIEKAYDKLNSIVNINDSEMKFYDIKGYISEIDMNLEEPWEDEIIVQNYKTKFEDLFSSIVAATEQIHANSFAYDSIIGAFGAGGNLTTSTIQNAINRVDLTYAFQSGSLTIDEINGIWATSDAGVVAMRGGGIFCATEKDSLGNWIWNTGILPSGINASLITSGQLDTNLIRIFAGDNLRLQLNADGLFAYNKNAIGEAIFDQYVVHNSDGLFLTQKKLIGEGDLSNEFFNKVEISWEGLKLRNNYGDEVFYADPETGDLTISGTLRATGGKIGAWSITERGLISDTPEGYYTNAGIVCAPERDQEGKLKEGLYNMLWVTGQENNGDVHNFYVQNDGTLFCDNVIVTGFIRAGSFIGITSSNEIDAQMKKLTLAYDGARFSFQNRNYDGNYLVDPTVRYLFIQTNALTPDELKKTPDSDVTSDYSFYYNVSIDEDGKYDDSQWEPLPFGEEANEDLIIWNPKALTFMLKSDIMYLEAKENNYGIKIPQSTIFFKVEKEGRARDESNPNNITNNYTYSAIAQFFSENHGVGKYITPMEPLSYTFVEDVNNFIEYAKEKQFYVELTGFTRAEIENNAYWLINKGSEQEIFEYKMSGDGAAPDVTSEANYAEIIVEANDGDTINIGGIEIPLEKEMELLDIDGSVQQDSSPLVKIDLIELEKGHFKATLILRHQKIPQGGSLNIVFCIDAASREAQCFKLRNGSDGISVILRSSSGSILEEGDVETELSAELFFGAKRVNQDDSPKQYYYVWKKDGIALSEAVEKIIIQDNSDPNEVGFIEKYITVTRPELFKRKNILVQATDFGVKSQYRCDIFDSLGEGELGEKDTALSEYLKNNEWQEEGWPASFYILKQPVNESAESVLKTSIEVEGKNLTYRWFLRKPGEKTFSDTGITTKNYSISYSEENNKSQVYCVVTGDLTKKGETIRWEIQSNIVTLEMS